MADVALLFQDTRQRRPLIDQGYLLGKPPRVFGRAFSFRRNGRFIAGDFVLARIQAGNHCGQRRAAQAAGHVAVRVGEAFLGELVDVRRLNNLVPHKAVISPGLVIGNDVNNIGRLRVTESGSEGGKENPYTLHGRTVQHVVSPLQAKRLEGTAILG